MSPRPSRVTVAPQPTSKEQAPPLAQEIKDGRTVERLPRLKSDTSSCTGGCHREHEAYIIAVGTMNARLANEAKVMRIKAQSLERSRRRHKAQLQKKSEQMKDERAALEETRAQLIVAEEKVCGEWLSVAGMRRKGFATRRELAMDRRFDTIVVASLGTYLRQDTENREWEGNST
jgi:hypothetical protein